MKLKYGLCGNWKRLPVTWAPRASLSCHVSRFIEPQNLFIQLTVCKSVTLTPVAHDPRTPLPPPPPPQKKGNIIKKIIMVLIIELNYIKGISFVTSFFSLHFLPRHFPSAKFPYSDPIQVKCLGFILRLLYPHILRILSWNLYKHACMD